MSTVRSHDPDHNRPHTSKEETMNKKIEPTDEMVLTALNAYHREQYRSWGRVDPETGEVQWEDRASLDEFADGVVKWVRAILTAALEVAPNKDDRPWEPLNGYKPRVDDEVRQDVGGIARTAVVGRVDADGDPWTAEGVLIGTLGYGTWYVRRPLRTLSTEDGAQIFPTDGAIEAVRNGVTYMAVRATYDAVKGVWVGVWRGEGGRSTYEMPALLITPHTAQGVE